MGFTVPALEEPFIEKAEVPETVTSPLIVIGLANAPELVKYIRLSPPPVFVLRTVRLPLIVLPDMPRFSLPPSIARFIVKLQKF
jgi:hypothetical protein